MVAFSFAGNFTWVSSNSGSFGIGPPDYQARHAVDALQNALANKTTEQA
jgi:hypothetical protein